MSSKLCYPEKYERMLIKFSELHQTLGDEEKKLLKRVSYRYKLSFQEFREMLNFFCDFQQWGETHRFLAQISKKEERKSVFLQELRDRLDIEKTVPVRYFKTDKENKIEKNRGVKEVFLEKEKIPIGPCPVASTRTLCCNLMTLDTARNCGFNCNYCSIQSFYPQGEIYRHKNLKEKLCQLRLDPDKSYHIGTGQSSDSLMWGNDIHVIAELIAFARENPNVILEFKTKSNNIRGLLTQEVPSNVICTWSLNPQIIIDHEEKGTASCEERILSAKKLAERGILIGFHFHPMIYMENFEQEYSFIAKRLIESFSPEQVAMVSFGTLTYTKKNVSEIRKRGRKTKVLKMSMRETNGKFSYPINTKVSLFSSLYQCFIPWHKKVFMYLCMEDRFIWKESFGYSYKDNNDFEKAMLNSYFKKINQREI